MPSGYNRFEQYAPIQWNLPKTDLGVLASVLDAKQKRFDTGYELSNELDNQYIDSLPQHRARANAIQQEWEKKKEDIINQYQGDYSSAYRDLRKLKQDMQRQINPGGEANAIMTQKKAFSDWYEAASKDREVNPESVNAAYNYYMNPESKGYIKDITKDPITGSYNIVTPEQVIGYTNPDDVILPAIKQLEAQGYEREQDSINGGWIMRNKESGEVLSAERIADTAYRALDNDKNFVNAQKQMARFRNIEDYDPQAHVAALAQSYGQDYAYSNAKTSQTIRANEWALHNDTERGKDRRHGQLMQSMQESSRQRGTLDYSQNALGKDLTVSDFTRSTSKGLTLAAQAANAIIPGMGNVISTIDLIGNTPEAILKRGALYANKEWGKRFITKLVENGAFEEQGGNPQLMYNILANSPEKITGSELLQEYNKQKKNVGSALQSATYVHDNEAAEAFSEQLLAGSSGQFTTITVAKPGGSVEPITYQDFISKYSSEIYSTSKDGSKTVNDQFKRLAVMTDGSDGYTPGFTFKIGNDIIKMETPPAYTSAKRPIIELTQAYHNSKGEGYTSNLGGFVIPFVDPTTGQTMANSWANRPMKMKVNYETVNGQAYPIKDLYEWVRTEEAPEGTWVPATYTINNPNNPRELIQVPLQIEDINIGLDQYAIPANFNTTRQTAKNTFSHDTFGNIIRTE